MRKIRLCIREYAKKAESENKVIFGGRQGEYKYYDMDKVIEIGDENVGENPIRYLMW